MVGRSGKIIFKIFQLGNYLTRGKGLKSKEEYEDTENSKNNVPELSVSLALSKARTEASVAEKSKTGKD